MWNNYFFWNIFETKLFNMFSVHNGSMVQLLLALSQTSLDYSFKNPWSLLLFQESFLVSSFNFLFFSPLLFIPTLTLCPSWYCEEDTFFLFKAKFVSFLLLGISGSVWFELKSWFWFMVLIPLFSQVSQISFEQFVVKEQIFTFKPSVSCFFSCGNGMILTFEFVT